MRYARLVFVMSLLMGVAVGFARANPISPDAVIVRASGTDVPMLVVLNVLIGILEAVVLERAYHVGLLRLCVLMTLANEFSLTAGWTMLFGLTGRDVVLQTPIEAAPMVLAAYALAVLLEWPFVWWAMAANTKRIRLSFNGSVLAQTVSYAAILAFVALRSAYLLTR